MSTLHIDSISKSFKNRSILSDIFLQCNKGEIVGLLGRNGAGKSTLLKIIFGTLKADYKFIKIGNKIIRNSYDSNNLINYLPQHHFLPNNTTIKTLINFFLSKDNRNMLVNNELIAPLLHKKGRQLSGGEKRLIEILLIIHSSAPFILLDEPFNGLSPIAKEYVFQYLTKMKTSKGYIITDHDYKNIISLSDKIFFLKDSYLKKINTIQELSTLEYVTATSYNEIRNSKTHLNPQKL